MRFRDFSLALFLAALTGPLLSLAACSPEQGAALFEREGCISCHSFKGVGGNTASDLTAVTERRSDDWIRRQIRDPSRNNPRTRMPAYNRLSRRQINAILRYLDG